MRKISLISITTIFLTLVIIISCQKEESKLALVTDIAIKTLPERINYYDGDVLDFKGIVVTLTLDNGDTEDVSLSSFLEKGITCFPEDGTELSKEIEDIIITHTASGQNTSYTINVNLIVSISIKTEPNKIDYYIGEYLDLSGLIILFNLDNGETVEIPFLNFENNELVCQPDNGTEITSDIKEIKITQSVFNVESAIEIGVIKDLIDIDGNIYSYIKIGNQIWMAENLKTTKYNNDKEISLIEDATEWSNLESGGFCWINNDSVANNDHYGVLYNWYAVSNNHVCPEGWHLPTKNEWGILIEFIRSDGYPEDDGIALKSITGWNDNGNGTDNYGFTALPGGRRSKLGVFGYIGNSGFWWSSEDYGTTDYGAHFAILSYSSDYIGVGGDSKKNGYSVRCLRDY